MVSKAYNEGVRLSSESMRARKHDDMEPESVAAAMGDLKACDQSTCKSRHV